MTLPKRKWESNFYLDYNAIALRLDGMADEVRQANYDGIAVLLRGGAFAGVHLAFLTGLPLSFLVYDRAASRADWMGKKPSGKRILICEDSAGKGQTLANSVRFVESCGYETGTLVVCRMPKSTCTPDFACYDWQDDETRVLFPWNRFRINGESIGDGRPDHEFERTAYDLDGVFVEDLPKARYSDDLEAALAERDDISPASYAPTVRPGDIIITARPEVDRDRTENWLKRHGIQVPVVFREDGKTSVSHEEKARFKGLRALELGYTHFVESNAEQATFIAALYPELRVAWWNRGEPILLQASRQPEGVTLSQS